MERKMIDNSEDDSPSIGKIEMEKKNKSTESSESEFIKKCETLINELTKTYKEQRNKIKNLMKLHKSELKNSKRRNKDRKKPETGFTKSEIVPDNLAKFIGIDKGTEMPRTALTKLVYNEIKNRKLYYEKDRRVLRADEELKKIFKLPDSVNMSINPKDELGFNFFNLQKYIAKCYPAKPTGNNIVKQDNIVVKNNVKNNIKKLVK